MIKFVRLGEACLVRRGTTITRKQTQRGNVPVIAGGRKATYFHNKHNRESGVITVSGSGASAGLVNYWSIPIFASDCSTVELKDNKQNVKFIYYYMKSMQEFIYKNMRSGAAQPHVYAKDIANLNFPLFSLEEQQRIVAKLDAVFAEIDKIKKLEETKLKKNETLIQNFIDKIFKDNKNLHKLSDCTQINPPKSEVNDLDDAIEVSFMPMKDIEINNKLAIPKQKRKLKDVKSSYTYFSEGDVLLAKITPCFENGKMGIASNLLNGIGFGSSEYIVFRPNKNLKNDWLYYFLNRNSFRIAGAQNMSGAVGHKRVDKNFIENTLIPIPSLEEQEKILSTLKSLFNHSKGINKIILKKIDEMNHLKKSILTRLLKNKLADAA